MNLSDVTFSRHALERFSQRWAKRNGWTLKNPEGLLRIYFLRELREVTESEVELLRSPKKEGGRFFSCGTWIFVITDDLREVITVFRKT